MVSLLVTHTTRAYIYGSVLCVALQTSAVAAVRLEKHLEDAHRSVKLLERLEVYASLR